MGRIQTEVGRTCRLTLWQFNKESKSCACKWNEKSHSLLPISRQMSSYVPESDVSACVTAVWEGRCHNHKCSPFFLSAFITEVTVVWSFWDVPLVHWGFLSVLHPSFLPTLCLLGGHGKESFYSVQVLSSHSQSISVSSTGLVTNLKHRSVQSAMNQINSILAKARTVGNVAYYSPFNIAKTPN